MVFVLHYNGLNSREWGDLRYDLTQENIRLKIFPNKITMKALETTPYSNLAMLFHSDTAVAFTDDTDLKKFLRLVNTNSKIEILGAKIDNELMSKGQIASYSKLPSLDQQRVELVQLLSQPSSTLLSLLKSNQTNLSTLLSQYVTQNSEEES